ncbi:MAG: long-chain fatty acid--CoA ligase [Deltaproteobacteria bacterium]|nr:long-chain fatty acid--CoA ligase [Deltaproteobacteria bacterium]
MNQTTITAQFTDLVTNTPSKIALKERATDGSWSCESFKEWSDRSKAIAAALINDDVKSGDKVAIFSYSRREWLEADMGILMAGGVTATIYQNLEGETVHYIIKDSGAKIIFAEGPVQLKAIFGKDKNVTIPDCLKKIVYFQSTQQPQSRPGKPRPAEINIFEVVPDNKKDILVSFEEYIKKGSKIQREKFEEIESIIKNITPDALAKIVYTSGTTGTPKGAMLTHGGLTSVTFNLDKTLGLRSDDTTLLFLPLAHVYAQLVYHSQMRLGFTIAFARSMLTAIEDAESIKPDFFVSVPRLFEKIYSTVLLNAESGGFIKNEIVLWAQKTGLQVSSLKQNKKSIPRLLNIQYQLADRLVFSKLREKLGGKVRMIISGGAPLQKEIIEFFHAANLLIIEGYGMTENSSLSHYNRIANFKFGTVGLPLDNTEVIIADDGEILLKGEGVMKGYLNQPEETKETIDEAGWLHTGDIGVIDDDNFLKITDRKKNIIVTSGGKNIAPAPIEAMLVQIKFVSQAVVFGDRKKFLTALLTLDTQYTESWAKEHGEDKDDLYKNIHLKRELEAEITAINQNLERYETIKSFVIAKREFTIEDGEVTPSLKLRKKIIEKRYGHLIDELYKDA